MMDNVARRLGLPQRQVISATEELSDPFRNVGIEIEVEKVNRPLLKKEIGSLWEVTSDGSLRPRDYSAEIRSPTPGYSGKILVDSINAAHESELLNQASFSWRCANHLHIDMRDKVDEDLHMMMVLYALIEPFIFAWDGTGRQESRFCMPWWVVAGDMSTAVCITNAQNNNEFHSSINRFSKYTALNLAPLNRFGTVEFRHAQATNNRTRILEYINICLDICNSNSRFPGTTGMDMVLEFMTDGPPIFIQRWFEAEAAAALLRPTIGDMPLTPIVFDRAISTALTLAELHQYKELTVPTEVDTELLTNIL